MDMQNKAKKLIEMIQTAPVEWKPLGEVFDLKNGYTPSKSVKEYWENGSIPWFRMEDIRENGRILDSALQQISESAIKGGKLFPANSIIMATSATIGEHALITVPFLANQRFTNLSLKPEFTDKFNIYFLYYYCFNLSEWCKKNTTTSSFASVDMNGFKRFPIPIPPLETQQKIVKILDKFTELEATLEAELALRKRQYQYYRDFLLDFDNQIGGGIADGYKGRLKDVVWKTLGEVCHNISSGKNKKRDINGIYPIYGSTGVIGKTNEKVYGKQHILVARVGANAGFVHIGEGEYDVSDNTLIIDNKDNILFGYLFYVLKNMKLNQFARGAGQPLLTAGQLKSLKIPIPPLPEQEKITAILDKFDTLTHSISEGLPHEIALRRKQYEYYREQLLAFPKAA
ncbi:restriction endonuclease subunit S [Eikenella corrodens]|uniref:restriction endonuclease subunit S n=1 Tax=Eikenella corrodens TaxID=539 RepID=UPI000B14EE82|nr:restriction endonuclease subunit S [Eikenella corrodens]